MKNFLKFLIIIFVMYIFNYNSVYAAGSSDGDGAVVIKQVYISKEKN